MEVALEAGYEEWWNDFTIDPEVYLMHQGLFENFVPERSAELDSVHEEFEAEEFDDACYCSAEEAVSVIPESRPESPEPSDSDQTADGRRADLEFREEPVPDSTAFATVVQHYTSDTTVQHSDYVLVLKRNFFTTSGCPEFKLVPYSVAAESTSPTMDESTRQEIKHRLAHRRPVTKAQPYPDEILHTELTSILHQHNILQKHLARTLGISQSALSSYFNKKPKINGWKSLERQLIRWKAEFLAKKCKV